jgi:hypothetical protein
VQSSQSPWTGEHSSGFQHPFSVKSADQRQLLLQVDDN